MRVSNSGGKSVAVITILTFACLTGCGPRFSIPPVNDHPIEKIAFKIGIGGVARNEYLLKRAKVHYTTKGQGCGFMDYTSAIGGIYKRPEAQIDFAAHGNVLDIYSDYFKPRKTCPFEIDQVIIELSDQNGVSENINANTLVIGLKTKKELRSKCEFAQAFNYYLCTNEGEFGFHNQSKQVSFMVDIRRF